jgi:hypothetical protein
LKISLLDTSLLLLLVIGAVDKRWIGRHKRSKNFVARDWQLLLDHMGNATLVTTPHILAETSNLLRKGGLAAPATDQLMSRLAQFISLAREQHIPARDVIGTQLYLRLGLTDAAILSIEEPDVHLLTTDVNLYIAAIRQGRKATNFNHLRDFAGASRLAPVPAAIYNPLTDNHKLHATGAEPCARPPAFAVSSTHPGSSSCRASRTR